MPKFSLPVAPLRPGAVLGFLIFLMVVAVAIKKFVLPAGVLSVSLHPVPVAAYLLFCAVLLHPAEKGPASRFLSVLSLAVALVSIHRLVAHFAPGWGGPANLSGLDAWTTHSFLGVSFTPATAFALAALHLALLAERQSRALAVAFLSALWGAATLNVLAGLFAVLLRHETAPAISMSCMILAAVALTIRLRGAGPLRPLFALGRQSMLLRAVIFAALALAWTTALAYARFGAVPPAGHTAVMIAFSISGWVMVALLLFLAHSLAHAFGAKKGYGERDPLTGIMTRRSLTDMASVETGTFGAVLFDLDHFRAINDRLGHDMGDKLLQKVATTISSHLRQTDIFGRWEGEQFLVVMRALDEHQLALAAERLRKLVETLGPVIENGENIPLTASFGISMVEPSETNIEGAVKRADMALFAAKTEGRNCVVPASTLSPEDNGADDSTTDEGTAADVENRATP